MARRRCRYGDNSDSTGTTSIMIFALFCAVIAKYYWILIIGFVLLLLYFMIQACVEAPKTSPSTEMSCSSQPSSNNLYGKRIAADGRMRQLTPRDTLSATLRSYGAVYVESIDRNTDLLISNNTANNSSKIQNAQYFGITIISENELIRTINTSSRLS